MANKKFWLGILAVALVFGMTVVGCEDILQEQEKEKKFDNTIYSVSISLGSGNNTPKVGNRLSTSVKNRADGSVSGISYQWKRADSQSSTFVNIGNATSNQYTLTIDDTDKYIKVEVKNSDTASPVLSNAVGPVVNGNTIYSVSIWLGYNNDPPKVGNRLSTSVENRDGYSVSGVSYQWKRADSQSSTFVNINNATESFYTPTIDDAGKYLKVEVKNSDTTTPVLSNAIGPVDANQVAKPTASLDGGEVLSGREITLTSTTENATIYYTLDGTTPTSNSNLYRNYPPRPTITSSCTLKAIATKYGMVDSEVLSVSYTMVAAPSFSSVTSSAAIFNGGIYSIAYGNNRYVAGGNSNIAYSTNGTTWTASTGNINFLVKGITYGTQFVAVGYVSNLLSDDDGNVVINYSGVINYSTDGTSWSNVTTTTFETSRINDVAYGNGRYVAVGEDGKIAYSTNGTSWTSVTDSTFGTSTIYGITYGAGKFIAVGASGKMAYSTNGTTWTAVADSAFSTSPIYGITYGGPSGKEKFIAVGNVGIASYQIAHSTDGVTWTRVSQYFGDGGLFGTLNRVVWGGNKFVAVAGSGVMYFSLDGTYWAKIDGGTGTGKSQFDTTGATSSINDIVYGGGRFIAVGNKYASLLTSTGEMAISNQQ